jgi:carbon monoxide dehydrogenase subunit G
MDHYESRSGKTTCTPEQIYGFITDIRNFEQFIPAGSIHDWQADADTCSFTVSHLGNVKMGIYRQVPYSLVGFRGTALKNNHFDMQVHISRMDDDKAILKVDLDTELNPFIKMVAAKPIGQFLEMVISRMEAFDCPAI